MVGKVCEQGEREDPIFVNSKELLSNGPYAPLIGLSIIKLLGTEFIISHIFQCEHYFSFACPGKFDKVS